MTDYIASAQMMADKLRPLVMAAEDACINGTQMIPLHRATVTTILQHLERLEEIDRALLSSPALVERVADLVERAFHFGFIAHMRNPNADPGNEWNASEVRNELRALIAKLRSKGDDT